MKLGVLTGIHEDVIRLEMAIEVLDQAVCEVIACLVGYAGDPPGDDDE